MSAPSSDSYVDAHEDIEPCLGPRMLADLPEEILTRIFSHVDAIQVARIQRVSRQWHRIIRSTPAVWRNALYLDYGLKMPSMPMMLFRLFKLASLSEWKLDKVGICLEEMKSCCLYCPQISCQHVQSMMHWFFEALHGISVRELVVFVDESACENDHPGCRDTVLQDLEQLTHADYESLVISFRGWTDEGSDGDEDEIERCPAWFDAVGLSEDVKHRLYLDRVNFSGMMKPSSKLSASLTGLHIQSLRFDDRKDARALWTLLEALQDTLHELYLGLTTKVVPYATMLRDVSDISLAALLRRSESETLMTLTFTKLTRFHLGYLGSCPFEHFGRQMYRFSCPVLKSLSLNGRETAMDVLFDDMLMSAVNYARMTCRTLAHEGNVKLLAKSQNVRKLFIDARVSFDSDDQRRLLHTALDIAPQELILVTDNVPRKADILSFVKLVEDFYPLLPKAPKVGFCNVIREHKRRQAHFDDLRKSIPNADRFVWMESDRPYFAMHEEAWAGYDVRNEL